MRQREAEARVAALEALIEDLQAQLQTGSRQQELTEFREKARLARIARDQASVEFAAAQRTRKLAEKRLNDVRRELQEERSRETQLDRDIEGLNRTLLRLQQRQSEADEKVMEHLKTIALLDADEEALQAETTQLEESISELGPVQQDLQEQLEVEHQKRLTLKAAVRAKMERVEAKLSLLRAEGDSKAASLQSLRQQVAAQQAETNAAKAALDAAKAEAADASERTLRQLKAKEEMHRQMLEVRRIHFELKERLKATKHALEQLAREDNEVQSLWRMNHLERLDSRLATRRAFDQEILIAAA